jgi:hypothetical protein
MGNGGVTQVVEYLSSKCEVQSSNPSAERKKRLKPNNKNYDTFTRMAVSPKKGGGRKERERERERETEREPAHVIEFGCVPKSSM